MILPTEMLLTNAVGQKGELGTAQRIGPSGGGSGNGSVSSVNGQTGAVVLDYEDVGAATTLYPTVTLVLMDTDGKIYENKHLETAYEPTM